MGTVLICGDEGMAGAIAEHHLQDYETRRVTGIEIGGRGRLHVSCVVACVERVTPAQMEAVERLMRAHPVSRLIVLTNVTGETARSLAGAPEMLRQVVGLREVATELPARIAELRSQHFLDGCSPT